MAEPTETNGSEIKATEVKHLNAILASGGLSLLLSAVFLSVSTRSLLADSSGEQINTLVLMTIARLFGIGAFIAGVVGIFNQRWTIGALLLIGSVVLPFVSLFINGTI